MLKVGFLECQITNNVSAVDVEGSDDRLKPEITTFSTPEMRSLYLRRRIRRPKPMHITHTP